MYYSTEPDALGQQIGRALLSDSDPQALLFKLARALGKGFPAGICALVCRSSPNAALRVGYWPETEGALDSLGDRTALWIALLRQFPAGQPWIRADLDSNGGELEGRLGRALSMRSIFGISISFPPEGQGYVLLGREQPQLQAESERERLASLVEPLTLALAQVSLQQQRLHAERDRQLRQRLSEIVSAKTDLDEILTAGLAATAIALQVSRAAIATLKYLDPIPTKCPTPVAPAARVEVMSQWSHPSAAAASVALPKSFTLNESPLYQQAWLAAPNPLAFSNRSAVGEAIAGQSPYPLSFESLSAVAIVPLARTYAHSNDPPTVLGFMVLQEDRPRLWEADELELAVWAGKELCTTVLNHQALRRVQSLVDERTSQLRRSLDVQAKLYETTRQQVEQLRQLNQLKDEFLSSMSHELNTPLATMRVAVQMLRQPGLPPERQARYLGILEQELKRESTLIRDLLTLQQLESNQIELKPQRLDLKQVLQELKLIFEQKWSAKGLSIAMAYDASLDSERAIYLNTDADSLRRILLELLTNAGKYSDPDTVVNLQVVRQDEPSEPYVVMSIANVGPGISPAEQEYIFEQFRRGEGATRKAIPGTGLGLALVRYLVRHLHGTIDVESDYRENGSGVTRFTLALPLRWHRD